MLLDQIISWSGGLTNRLLLPVMEIFSTVWKDIPSMKLPVFAVTPPLLPFLVSQTAFVSKELISSRSETPVTWKLKLLCLPYALRVFVSVFCDDALLYLRQIRLKSHKTSANGLKSRYTIAKLNDQRCSLCKTMERLYLRRSRPMDDETLQNTINLYGQSWSYHKSV